MSQAFSYTGSHSSHCNYTYILYIGTFKEPPPDSFLLLYIFLLCMCGKVATVATWAAFGGAYLLLSVNYGQNPAPGQSLFLREPLRQTHLPANSRRVIPSEVFHASGITYQSFLCWNPLIEQYCTSQQKLDTRTRKNGHES